MQLGQRLAVLLISRGTLIETTHSQLANELGSVREVISRILKDFEGKGLIKLERGKIQILDPKSLRHMSPIRDSSHRLFIARWLLFRNHLRDFSMGDCEKNFFTAATIEYSRNTQSICV